MAKDPAEGLEPDITTIEDVKEREAQQLEYYGGDPIDDDDDLAELDRGDDLEEAPTNEDRGDEVTETEEEEKGEDAEAEDDEADTDAESEADDTDSDAEDEPADEDDEGDTDESDEDDVNVVEPEDSKERDPGIPRQRFNEVNERMKAAERRLAELEAQSTAKAEAAEDKYDFDKAESEYMDLLLDGKTEEATAKRREIRTAEQEIFKQEAKTDIVQETEAQAELRDLNDLSRQAEEAYPVFTEGHPDYDPLIANKVVVYMKGYMADGQSVSDAFVSGLADVIEQYDLDGKRQPSNQATEKQVTKGKPIKKTAEKVAAAKKAVPSPAGHGEGSAERGTSTPSIEDMSDADLDKLTPEQLGRLRGDFL